MEDHADLVALTKSGMEKDVSVMRVSTRSLVSVVHVIQIHPTMDSIVSVIKATTEIEIFARNVMNHVEDVQDPMQVNVKHVPISAIDLIMDFVPETLHVLLVSTWKALNVRNVLTIVMSARICLLVMFALMASRSKFKSSMKQPTSK